LGDYPWAPSEKGNRKEGILKKYFKLLQDEIAIRISLKTSIAILEFHGS